MIAKIYSVLKNRPLFVFQYVRTHLLFQRTRFYVWVLQKLNFYPKQIHLKKTTRIQRLRCVRTEGPYSEIRLGEHSIVYENAQIESYAHGKIEIDEGALIGDTRIYSRSQIKIGKRFLSSWNTYIGDFDPHPLEQELRKLQVEGMTGQNSGLKNWNFPSAPIIIGDDVWMGANSTILKGAQIGSGCVIAAHSVVVAGHYPEQSLLGGIPAKVIKSLKTESLGKVSE